MKDYVRVLMDAWTANGNQAAYDLCGSLTAEIEDIVNSLRKQSAAIAALEQHLEDLGVQPRRQAAMLDTVRPAERARLITEVAINLWHKLPVGNDLLNVQDVLEELRGKGLDLGVQQPFAVIGTVLTRADGFTKVARNTFEYRQSPVDLPF